MKNRAIQIGGEQYNANREVARDGGRVVLAYGEATGHAHAITSKNATLYDRGDDAHTLTLGTRILSTRTSVALTHEEHGTIDIPKGKWGVRIQRQYEAGAFRRVED